MNGRDVLSVEGLEIGLNTRTGRRPLVYEARLCLREGERVALVGESGSGKTILSLSVMRLNKEPTTITGGSVLLDNQELTTSTSRKLEDVRGNRIAMIYQDPLSCLNPVQTIGKQIVEAILAHQDLSHGQAREDAIDLLNDVGVGDAATRMNDYPHQFSGGMRQRVMIAMAISCSPDVLIADEPTTALDVTTQARILQLLDRLAHERGMAILLITHDLAVAGSLCQRIYVMRKGRIVESGKLDDVLSAPQHEYTRELLKSVVTLQTDPERTMISEEQQGQQQILRDEPHDQAVLVAARDLTRRYGTGVLAVNNVSLKIHSGETFGLVGESGSGKSTLSGLLLGLDKPTSGVVSYRGTNLHSLSGKKLRQQRRDMQVVLQDPVGSLNRRKTVEQIIGLPLSVHESMDRAARLRRVTELLDLVGLPGSLSGRYPSELSGGQCQRVNIARAIALEPSFLVLDEAVSAVDVLIQAQILDLLRDLQSGLGLTYLFVSHDLAVVRYMAPRLAVMYRGTIVEEGSREQIFQNPQHEYTRALLDSVPTLDVTQYSLGNGRVSE